MASSSSSSQSLSKYRQGRMLGTGTYGDVFEATRRIDNLQVRTSVCPSIFTARLALTSCLSIGRQTKQLIDHQSRRHSGYLSFHQAAPYSRRPAWVYMPVS